MELVISLNHLFQEKDRRVLERSIQLDGAQLLALVRRAFPNCHRLDDSKILSVGALIWPRLPHTLRDR